MDVLADGAWENIFKVNRKYSQEKKREHGWIR